MHGRCIGIELELEEHGTEHATVEEDRKRLDDDDDDDPVVGGGTKMDG